LGFDCPKIQVFRVMVPSSPRTVAGKALPQQVDDPMNEPVYEDQFRALTDDELLALIPQALSASCARPVEGRGCALRLEADKQRNRTVPGLYCCLHMRVRRGCRTLKDALISAGIPCRLEDGALMVSVALFDRASQVLDAKFSAPDPMG
jgi:hypothetical protein